MKKIITILIVIFLSISVRAEYNGYHIKFAIKTTKEKINIGFVYVASAYLNTDSLKNTEYLKKALNKSDKKDSLVYFRERIKYEYRNVGDSLGEKIQIYSLNNKQAISLQDIMSISIVEMIDDSYLIGISSPLSISDTTWINKAPLSSYAFGGYLCYHQIFVHKSSKKIENIINKLKTKQKILEGVEINHENGDKIDGELWEIIKELYTEKVVIITECTC